jgi:hypothetical protein
MSNDLLPKPDQATDPIQQNYNDDAIFSQLTDAERMAKDGVSGGGAASPAKRGGFFNRNGDKSSDDSAASSAAAVGAAGLGAAEALGNGFNPVGELGMAAKLGKALLGSRRRKQATAGGGVIGVVVGGTFFAFTIASGPLQLIHLGEILAKNFTHTQHSTELRSRGLFRFARSGDIGQTRVGILGARSYAKTVAQLEQKGITFNKGSISGSITDVTLDPEKLSDSIPELKGKTPELQLDIVRQRFPSIANELSLSNGKIVGSTSAEISIVRGFSKESISLLSDTKALQALKFRPFAKVINTPSLWHPLKRLQAKYETKLAVALEAKRAEEERIKAEQSQVEAKSSAAEAELSGKFSGAKIAAGSTLLLTALVCQVRDASDAIVTYNHDAIVLKSEAETLDVIAAASQTKYSNPDTTNYNVSKKVQSLTDENGKSVWTAKALQETAMPGSGSGEDVNSTLAQAFMPSNTARNLKDNIGFGNLGGVVCSTGGKLIQVGIGIVLIGLSIPSGGLSTAALVGLKTATLAGQAVITAGVFYAIKEAIVELGKNHSVVPIVLSGPVGGNIMAIAARSASNTDAMADGGVMLSDTQTAAVDARTENDSSRQFKSKSFIARTFDTHDYRSLASRAIDSGSANVTQDANNIASLFTSFSSIPKLFSTIFFPRAHAANTPYQWPMPRYDIPDSVLTDPKFINNYDNANAAANMLDSEISQGGTDYIGRAKTCFGDTISKGQDGWQVVYDSDVNPNSDAYTDAKCSDTGDDWHRVMLFIKDSRTMDAAACFDFNDATSCTNVGINTTSGGTTTDTPAAAVTAP